jgi:methionyl-tRNA synthetase
MNSDRKTFYVTSPIFYPNANLHLGHAYTMTMCDILARYKGLTGHETYFLTGADENTAKVTKAAKEKNESVDEFLKGISDNFKKLFADLDISYDQFIQTTDKNVHWPGAQEMWKRLVAAGDIYKGTYEGLYCPQCEAFYTEKDLVDGKCPYHGIVPEKIKEENYFFKLSKYTSAIKEKISRDEIQVMPVARKNEIMALLERGLEDVSFSRPAGAVPHAIPVPDDPTQVIYVWCDALVNYISALGFGRPDDKLFKKFWPADIHVVGKDILRFHAAIWPAMLMSAGLELPITIFVHGLIMSGGRKMSKSLGNVIDPYELINEYGKDAVRYYLAREIPPFEDGELTRDSFKNAYNANLANGLGNLVSRVLKMAEANLGGPVTISANEIPKEYTDALNSYDIKRAADVVWREIAEADLKIQETQPFKLVKEKPDEARKIITELVEKINTIAIMLQPILPETSGKIFEAIKNNKMPGPLFQRK